CRLSQTLSKQSLKSAWNDHGKPLGQSEDCVSLNEKRGERVAEDIIFRNFLAAEKQWTLPTPKIIARRLVNKRTRQAMSRNCSAAWRRRRTPAFRCRLRNCLSIARNSWGVWYSASKFYKKCDASSG